MTASVISTVRRMSLAMRVEISATNAGGPVYRTMVSGGQSGDRMTRLAAS